MTKSRPKGLTSELGIAPVIALTMAEMVEVKIQDYLKENEFKVGDAIPKEMELAEALGVSRNVVREALSRFRMLGLIESKKKRGMILTSPDVLGGMERVLHPKLLSQETLRDIFEMRLVFEMGMADLVFARKTTADIEDLERIVHKRKKQDTTQFKLEQEIEFHGRLYEIAGNETMKRFQRLLLPVFEYVIEYESGFDTPPKVGSATHEDIVREVRDGNTESFRQAMHRHLEPHFDILQTWKIAD